MGLVSVDMLKPGMTLATELRSRQGRALLPEGMELSDKHIRTLKIWGVAAADIAEAGDGGDEQQSLTAEQLQAAKPYALSHFRFADRAHPVVRALMRLYVRRICVTNKELPPFPEDVAPAAEAQPRPLDPAALARENAGLVSLPEVFHKVLDAINDPRTSAGHIAELVSRDANLSARLLRLVNSPYYGFAEKIATLSRALALVGTDKLGQLVVGMGAVDAFKDVDRSRFDLYGFWQHSVTCALVASALAHEMDTDAEEESFVTGLLHDIGRVAVAKLAPEATLAAMGPAQWPEVPPLQVEKRCWGTTHAVLGGELLRTWHLPDALRRGVAEHHTPRSCGLARQAVLAHVADVIAHAMDRRLLPGGSVPALEPEAWEALGLTSNVIDRVVVQVDGQLQEIMGVFFNGQ